MSNIADKIQKILNKANSTNSDAEAEMLMQKVHSMLEKHGMDLMDLNLLDDDPIGVDKGAVECAPAEKWQVRLCHMVASYYGCDTIFRQGWTQGKHKQPTTIAIGGRKSARVTVEAMWPFIRQQVRAQGRALAKETGRGPASEVNAVANALCFRIHRLIQSSEPTSSNSAAVRNALVPVDAIKAAMQEAFPNATDSKKMRLSTNQAAREAADKVSLYRQTGSNRGQRRIAS